MLLSAVYPTCVLFDLQTTSPALLPFFFLFSLSFPYLYLFLILQKSFYPSKISFNRVIAHPVLNSLFSFPWRGKISQQKPEGIEKSWQTSYFASIEERSQRFFQTNAVSATSFNTCSSCLLPLHPQLPCLSFYCVFDSLYSPLALISAFYHVSHVYFPQYSDFKIHTHAHVCVLTYNFLTRKSLFLSLLP